MPSKKLIYSINDFCNTNTLGYFKIASFDAEACTINEFSENHRHEHYEIIWLKKGIGSHMIDGQNYPYNGSVIFLLSPGQIHKLNQEEKAEGFVIKFLPDVFTYQSELQEYIQDTLLFDSIEASPVINMTSAQYKIFEELFYQINVEFNTSGLGQRQILSSFLKILITNIIRLKQQQILLEHKTEPNYEIFRKYKILVEKEYKKIHSVNQYANLLNTTTRQLNEICKKFVNKTAGQIITERIILEAKRCLYHQSLSVKEIAYELGFEDPAYFTRFFKNNTGVSPLQYKEESKN